MVSLAVVELNAQLSTSEGSYVSYAVYQKLGAFDVVFFDETVEERRPQKWKISGRLYESFVLVNVAGSVPRRL